MNQPLRIGIITTDARHWFKQFESEVPNFGTAVQSLLQGFDGMKGVEVHVISASPSVLKSPEKLGENIWFHHISVPKWQWGKTLFLGVALHVRKLIRKLNLDIIHGQGTERDCSMAAVLSSRPNVLTIHGNMRVHASRPEQKGSLYYKIAATLESFCLGRTDGVVAISNYTLDLVQGISSRNWLLPNAVDANFFNITHCPPSVPRILFVGSLDPRKNPLGLLKACAKPLQQGKCTLALAGVFHTHSDYGKEVMALAQSLPGISFLGFLNRKTLADEFGASSLLVLPTFEDNCPMVVLEAMAAGLPVAASRVGGVPDLVKHETTGILFDPNSLEATQSAILRFIDSPELRESFGTAGRKHALETFHPQVIAQKHLEIYQSVLQS